MAKGASRTFHPPTADQVSGHLERYAVVPVSPMQQWMPALIVGVLVLLALSFSNAGITLIVWLAMLGLFLNSFMRTRAIRETDKLLARVQELTLERQNFDAMRLAWQVIPQLRARPQQHTRAVALLAHNLEQIRAYEAAVVAFNEVLGKLPDEHPAAVQLRVEQTMALLASDQLTDADIQLRRLRNLLDRFSGSAIAGGFHLALLYQQIRTNHFRDAADNQQGMMDKLRPLGIDAGLGYALLALACYHSAAHAEDPLIKDAQLWWERATLLLPLATLVRRFPELQAIEQGPAIAARMAKPAPPTSDDASTPAQEGGQP